MVAPHKAENQQPQVSIGAVNVWTYFKPQRRKIGVVTLLMSCAFTVGWVRSLVVGDLVIAQCHAWAVNLRSDANRIGLTGVHSGPGDEGYSLSFRSQSSKQREWKRPTMRGWDVRIPGFYLGLSLVSGGFHVDAAYFNLVAPLTLLSAYLLLTKPRATGAQVEHTPAFLNENAEAAKNLAPPETQFTSPYPWTIEHEGVKYVVITDKDFALMDVVRGKLFPWKPHVLQALEKHLAGTSMRMSTDKSKSTEYDTFYEIDEYCIRIDSNTKRIFIADVSYEFETKFLGLRQDQ